MTMPTVATRAMHSFRPPECLGDFAPAEQNEGSRRLSSTALRLGSRSSLRDGTFPNFDQPVAYADIEGWLWVDGGTVDNMAVFQRKPGSVIGTFDAVVHQLAFRKRSPEVRTRVGHGKETSCAADEKNGYALSHRPGWFVIR